jgi:hypothetical protein
MQIRNLSDCDSQVLNASDFPGREMRVRDQIRSALVYVSMAVALLAPSFAQNHDSRSPRQQPAPRPPSRNESRPQPRYEPRQQPRHEPPRQQSRPESRPRPAPQSQPHFQAAPLRDYRPYQPPAQGHHSGQWLNQHRELPLDQQRRALQNDPQFRRLPPERQQRLEQRLQRFDNLPPERQQQVLRRMETWEHLTPQQKQEFRGVGSQFNSLPPDRRQAVRNAIESLRAMPPQARQHEIESGRFSQFSPQERQILSGASRLPLAPAENEATPSQTPSTGPQRYVPRPPH